MTFDELYQHILEVCPNAECSEDVDGQIVVHTGMTVGKDNIVRWLDND